MGRKKKEVPALSKEGQALFQDIYYRYRGLILSTARKVAPNQEELPDLLQDSYIKLMQNIETISALGCYELAAYIILTIKRTQIDRYRAREKDAGLLSLNDDAALSFVQKQAIQEHIPLDADARLDVMQLFDEISDKDRMILICRYLEGCSVAELAQKLNCKPDSVRMALSRLRKRAAKILNRKDGENDG